MRLVTRTVLFAVLVAGAFVLYRYMTEEKTFEVTLGSDVTTTVGQ